MIQLLLDLHILLIIIHQKGKTVIIALVSNNQLVALLQQQEVLARAACLEYECNQADYSYFGTPQETTYRSFKPYNALLVR